MMVLFVLTRNEAALLRLNIAHHLGWGFDHVAVADNESTDATQDVIRQFGDAVTAIRISDPYDRYSALNILLHEIESRYGAVEWCAISDTDEFWWAPGNDLRELLAHAKDVTVAVNSGQKLFLPTERDAAAGPVYCRRTYRTSGSKSPFHTSHRAGKSVYRGAWLRTNMVTNPHWSTNVSHELTRFSRPLVHHYMIDGEDNFVEKIKLLERWNPQLRTHPDAAAETQDPNLGDERSSPIRDFKTEWWRLYQAKGEAGLRDYYRTKYLIPATRLAEHLERGDLVEDSEFADFKRSNPDP